MNVEAARPAVVATKEGAATRLGRWLFRHRDVAFPIVFLSLAFAGRPLAGPGRTDRLLDTAGLGLVALGYGLRVWVMGTTYLRRAGRGKRLFADALERGGLFAHCRNPLYLGNLLVLAGLALIRDSVLFYAVGLPLFVAIYAAIALAEEDYLERRFGEAFEDYRRWVPRFGLRLSGLGRTLASARFDWRQAVRGEYSSVHTGLLAALLLLVWEDLEAGGWAAARPTLAAALAAWVPLAVSYLVIRGRKKAGQLGAGY